MAHILSYSRTVAHILPRAMLLAGMILVGMMVLSGGCEDGESGTEQAGVATTRTATKSPVTLTFTVTPVDLDFSEQAEVKVEVEAEPGVDVYLDDYARTLAEEGLSFELRVADAQSTEPMAGGPSVWTYRCRLAFVLPGEYELPPARLTFTDNRTRTAAAGTEGENTQEAVIETLNTESITIIARDPSEQAMTPEELSSITVLDPIELPRRWSPWWWLALPVVVACVSLWLLRHHLRRRWRRSREARAQRAAMIPAHEWARRELAALMAQRLMERSLLQEFHYGISYIVRGFIERRFGVSAGEMTTQEFLEAAVADARFGPQTTEQLHHFMDTCDMVKYARHEPTAAESDAVLHATESFIDRNRADRSGDTVGKERVEFTATGDDEERAA